MLHDALGIRTEYRVGTVLYELQTAHQHLVLIEHPFYGKMLFLDGAVQITSRDEFVYREMMSHVPIFAHGAATQVLVIGGGDCSVASEALKHRSVRNVTQVEIDKSVIDFSREYFPEFTEPAFADTRFESVIADGATFVAETERRFDVIIVDSTDPQGPGAVLFSREFYAACKHCLTENGILVTQNGVPFLQRTELLSSIGHFRMIFDHSGCYLAVRPTYVGGYLAIGWASALDMRTIAPRTIAERYAAAGSFPTTYWSPEVHQSCFALPRFIGQIVEGM